MSTVRQKPHSFESDGWRFSILVGTHHKSGTVLFAQVFREAAKTEGVPRYKSVVNGSACSKLFTEHQTVGVCIDEHVSMATLRAYVHPGVRLVHAVRDPLEMCVSSYQYNLHSTEPWLHIPRSYLGNRTLQRYFQSLPREDGVRMECRRSMDELVEMAVIYNATRGSAWAHTVRLEDTGRDYDGSMRAMFDFLGSGSATPALVKLASHHDLSRVKADESEHVSSAGEKGPLRDSLLADAALGPFLGSLRALIGYTDAPPPSREALCEQVGLVCADLASLAHLSWCSAGRLLHGGPAELQCNGSASRRTAGRRTRARIGPT